MKKTFSFREVLWHSPERAFEANGRATILYNVCEKHTFKILLHFQGGGGGGGGNELIIFVFHYL